MIQLKEFLLKEALSKIFHTSTSKFRSFKPRPAWFSLNEKDALAWHNNGSVSGDQISYICKYIGGKIASIKQSEKIAKQVWPDEDFIYSMYDETVAEFDKLDIQKFISLLTKSEYDGAYIDDYNPADFSSGSSKSLVVFNPSKNVVIEDRMKIDKTAEKKSEGHSISEFKVGDHIEFSDDALKKHKGIVKTLLPKGTKLSRLSKLQQEGVDYKDSLEVEADGHTYLLTLYKFIKIKHI